MSTDKKFLDIKNSSAEKDVERKWVSLLLEGMGGEAASPHRTDGILDYFDDGHKIRVLFEFKYNTSLANPVTQSSTVLQAIFYIKKYIIPKGEIIPDIIFVGDMDECFIVPVIQILKYLDRDDINWEVEPSGAANANPEVVVEMSKTDNYYIYNEVNFSVDRIKKQILSIKKEGSEIKTKILINNIQQVYKEFEERVFSKKNKDTSINDKVNIFLQAIFNDENTYLHPNKQNLLVTRLGEKAISSSDYKIFMQNYSCDFEPEEMDAIVSAADVLIEEETRRSKGEYYTPKIWVDEAHKLIEESFGKNWKNEYVVWDCAWGIGNLTRDYRFSDLYCSTLEQSDIETAKALGINQEAKKIFKFDFLNDSIDDENFPEDLRSHLEGKTGKQVIFLINPPYATPSGNSDKSSNTAMFGCATSKDVTNNYTSEKMRKGKFGGSDQLYIQFLYRIWSLNDNGNVHIAHFIPLLFKTGEKYEKCRSHFFSRFKFINGFIIPGSEFSDVSEWPIDFSIWKSGTQEIQNRFKLRDKDVYNLDGNEILTDFVKSEGTPEEYPTLSNYNTISEISKNKGIPRDAIGTFCSVGNMVGYKDLCYILTAGSSRQGGKRTYIYKRNLLQVCCVFCAKRCITKTIENDKNCFYKPNQDHPNFERFLLDSLIYSIFNDTSQQSSLCVKYNNKYWDIPNQFFWIDLETMKTLSNTHNFNDMFKTCRTDSDRIVFDMLHGDQKLYHNLSPDAKKLIDISKDLVINSFPNRILMNIETPELQLYRWDAGYAQLKTVWKAYSKEQFQEFRQLYKSFELRMSELVYELGFLER